MINNGLWKHLKYKENYKLFCIDLVIGQVKVKGNEEKKKLYNDTRGDHY